MQEGQQAEHSDSDGKLNQVAAPRHRDQTVESDADWLYGE
jgi:hypothetical protein